MKNNFNIFPYNNSYPDTIFKLLIINNFLIDKFLNEDNNENFILLSKYLGYEMTLIYLYKYNYINIELYNLFHIYSSVLSTQFEISEFLSKDNDYFLEKQSKSKYSVFALNSIFKDNRCHSVKLLNYLSNNFSDISNDYDNTQDINIPLFFPFDIIKKYKNKFFKPNTLYVTCNDKFSEEFINVVFTDMGIKSFLELKINYSWRSAIFDRNNFNYNDKFNYKIINKNENKNKKYIRLLWSNIKNDKPIYDFAEEFIKLKKPKKYNTLNKYDLLDFYSDREEDVDNDYLNKLNFVNNYLLNNNELNKILDDPMYIFNSKFDTTSEMELFLIR